MFRMFRHSAKTCPAASWRRGEREESIMMVLGYIFWILVIGAGLKAYFQI